VDPVLTLGTDGVVVNKSGAPAIKENINFFMIAPN
jgi:hypothetical protein